MRPDTITYHNENIKQLIYSLVKSLKMSLNKDLFLNC